MLNYSVSTRADLPTIRVRPMLLPCISDSLWNNMHGARTRHPWGSNEYTVAASSHLTKTSQIPGSPVPIYRWRLIRGHPPLPAQITSTLCAKHPNPAAATPA